MRYLVIFLLLALISCSTKGDSDGARSWERYRADAAMSGYTDARLPDNPSLLWRVRSDSRTACSPLVSGDVVYWIDKRGVLRGVNTDGIESIRYEFGSAIESTPIISDGVMYVGRMNGFMSAFSLQSRDTLWNFETFGQISASPNIVYDAGRKMVIFGSYDNYLYSLDAADGKEVNRFESGYYINGAVALWGTSAVVGGCDGWLRVVDVALGVVTDSLKVKTYIPASPAIVDSHVYVADYSGNVYDVTLKDGRIIKSSIIFASKSDQNTIVSVPACSDDVLYFLSDDKYLYAIDRDGGRQLWRTMLSGETGESSPVVARDKVLVCSKSGVVTVIDAENGAIVWEYDTGEQITASAAVVQGRFYILTAKGSLLCFGTKTE